MFVEIKLCGTRAVVRDQSDTLGEKSQRGFESHPHNNMGEKFKNSFRGINKFLLESITIKVKGKTLELKI